MAKTKRSGILIGTAGVYFIASQLAVKGSHAAPTFGNAPNVDILVGQPDGAATLSIQVKTSWRALKTHSRGKNKQPHHYEWDVGERSAKLNQPDLFFAFVDFKGLHTELPDVFIVPSRITYKYFEKYFESGLSRWRWHPKLEIAEQYKNKWEILSSYLNQKSNNTDSKSEG